MTAGGFVSTDPGNPLHSSWQRSHIIILLERENFRLAGKPPQGMIPLTSAALVDTNHTVLSRVVDHVYLA
jgi:hypothetical protein